MSQYLTGIQTKNTSIVASTCLAVMAWCNFHCNMKAMSLVACEQWKGRGGERKEKKKARRKGEPVGIHRCFDCSSFIIYAGSSINY